MAAEEAIRTVSALATQLVNQISVHMLNYLSTTHDLPDGFRELSHTFLDTCRTLWAIEVGVTELAAANRALPAVIIDEVEKKYVAAYRDFQHLEKVILKLVQYEHRGTLGKIQRGWHRPGHELNRIHDSLKTNETLQISGMAFHWSLGEAHPEESVGTGYASLAAALDRIAKGRSVMAVNKTPSIDSDRSPPSTQRQSPNSMRPTPAVPPKAPSIIHSPKYMPAEDPKQDPPQQDSGSVADGITDDMSSILSLNTFFRSHPGSEAGIRPSFDHRLLPPRSAESISTASAETSMPHDSDTDLDLGLLIKPTLSKPDAFPLLRPQLSQTIAVTGPNVGNSFVSAIRGREHSLIEQLLASGVSPDKHGNFHPLNEAVTQRDIESMRLLLIFKANPNTPDSLGKTPLLLTVEQSFVDCAIILLDHGADVDYRAKPELESPLSYSMANSKVNLTQTLLAHGGNPNEATRNGSTLLIEAIRKRAPQKLIEVLLEAGCDPNRKDNHGKTALCEAVQSDQPAIVTTLLDHNANPNLPGPEHALWSEVYRPGCLRILLARGADTRKAPGLMEQATSVNSIDAVRVLLQAAIRDDRPDIIAMLLSHGADANLMASEYPAWKCITHNRLHFLPDLVAAGADLHQPPGIVECAVQLNNMEAMHWLVEQRKANPNDRNAQGHMALTTAIRENRPEILEWLLAHGADPNLRGQGWPVYMATKSPTLMQLLLPSITDLAAHKGVIEKAVQANQLENIKLLLAAGANVEWKNGGVAARTPLGHCAFQAGADPNAPGEHLPLVKAIRRCDDGDFSMIKLLLDKGADPNTCYRDWNAIMQAIENRDLRLLQLLIEGGGRVDLAEKDETGQTVLDMAESSGWLEGTQLLMENSTQ
ncbi:uncharacterized protein N7477_006546 [Penicillium maclennaniae]|uniref:uncharacterized protein n=1 Tax=Penicillium maclennaniae TaxID=1343394 RepID=UPI00253F8678|nr:uncharacterized protein N7477_006546 [Penicillium maclennaniae]KAJ5667976.1 hypothetical protein N7477_006546 [Penicillium maclennaniae]